MESKEAQELVKKYEEFAEFIENRAYVVFDAVYPDRHSDYLSFLAVEGKTIVMEESYRGETEGQRYFPIDTFFMSDEQLSKKKESNLADVAKRKLETKAAAEKQKETRERQLLEELQKKYNPTN